MSHNSRQDERSGGKTDLDSDGFYRKLDPSNISFLGEDFENSDSLSIRPPQMRLSSHKQRREEHHRERQDRHRDKHLNRHYRESNHRPSSSHGASHREKRSRREGDQHKSDRINKENKGDLLESRHSDLCKYDAKKKDIRNSHRDSESHRRHERDLNRKSSKSHESNREDNRKHNRRDREYFDEIMDEEALAPVEESDSLKRKRDDFEEITKPQKSADSTLEKVETELEFKASDNEETQSGESSSAAASTSSDDEGPGEETKASSVDKSSPVSPLNLDDLEELGEEIENATDEPVQKIDESLPAYFPAIEGCRSVEEFLCLNRIEEGTYGVVYRFKDKRTDDIVALKKLKMEKEKEGFPITSLREINTLLKSQHPNIVTVREIVVGSNMDKIFIVMDYVEHDLKSLIELMRNKHQKFMPGEIKCLLKQLLLAVAHLHDNWILHRDLKTSNLLLSHKGILKVGDFGLAREYGSPLKPYTPIVVTLWYRAPELLLGAKEYSAPIDMWSVGCIFAEFILMHPLFSGKSEIEQLNRFFKCLGTPTEKIWPGYNKLPMVQKVKFSNYPASNLRKRFQMLSDFGLNLLTNFLTYDPSQRITAEEALKHPYFLEFPAPIDPSQFPKWPAKSELGQKRAMASSPKPPSGGGEFKKLGDEDGFRIGMETDNSRMGAGFSLKF